eukprot:TRINITY_DN12532_c0_g1_i6.p1 TRINITY_DN12532_c0_g1~~TRINITY_DN12532_c0_g1_i6.p1  ORF type:complete len:331 (-),score=70.50 TRINITY_DN12532_c0_g1_i6:40-1032(-)
MKSLITLPLLELFVCCFSLPDILKPSQHFNSPTLPLSFYQRLANSTLQLEAPNNCSKSFLKLLLNPLSNQVLVNVFLFTGKRLNDLGDYRGCINHTITRYIQLKTPSFSLGICLPLECTLESIGQIKPAVVRGLEELSGAEINESLTEWIDVRKENEVLGEIRTGNIIFFAVLALILTISVVATVIDQFNKCENTKLVQLFSIPRNLDRLFVGRNAVDPNLEVFNGVKLIAMFWVLCGHTYLYDSLSPTYNLQQFKAKLLGSFHHSFVKTSSLAGDVFFFLSGFLAAIPFYFAFKRTPQHSRSVVLASYLRRYLRPVSYTHLTLPTICSV